MTKIELTFEEIGKASSSGLKQYSKKHYKDSKLDNHLIGKLGEMAYGKLTKQEVNLEHYENYGDGGSDFGDGTQVKTVTWAGPNKQIKVSSKDASLFNKNVTMYALMYVDTKDGGAVAYLIGTISKANFLAKKYVDSKFGKDVYVVDEKDLDTYYSDKN